MPDDRKSIDRISYDQVHRIDALYPRPRIDGSKTRTSHDQNPPADAYSHKDAPAQSRSALVVGCGLGDDAERLSAAGFRVKAFDSSDNALAWARRRFPESHVEYIHADLFSPPESWAGAFDVVLESHTLEMLPPGRRADAIHHIAGFVAPAGVAIVISRAREETDPAGDPPTPLTRSELGLFESAGLVPEEFVDFLDDETPPVRRFVARYRRPA